MLLHSLRWAICRLTSTAQVKKASVVFTSEESRNKSDLSSVSTDVAFYDRALSASG